METEKDREFHKLFEQFVECATRVEDYDRDELVRNLIALAKHLRIAKGVTEFYRSETHRRRGEGQIFCDFDNGHADYIVYERGFSTKTGAIIRGTVYMSEDEPKLTDEEMHRVDISMRALISFIARKRMTDTIEQVGFYDEAQYPNLRYLTREIDQRNLRRELSEYAAIHFNLRHFSVINQDIGRKLGDIVMRNYFNAVSAAAGEDSVVCRVGGDNFLGMVQKQNLDAVLDIIRGIPVCYDEKDEKRVNVAACCGVYMIPDDFVWQGAGSIMDKVMPAAIIARRGDTRSIVFCNSEMMKTRERIMMIQRAFPEALAKQEFKVYYQPKVDIRNGKIVGAEALCRWFHDGKMISPGDFIPVLEQNTDICRLDFYMLDMVCRDIRRWIDEGREPVRISVNLSRKNLVDIDLQQHILEIVNRNNVPHAYVEIELTETTTDVEFRDLKRVSTGLRTEGIFTSVDDFGMGYSSLNLIREIPWDVLKIDRCFLPEDDDSDNSVTNLMYKHVVSLAIDMGLECITEGVETEKQLELLARNNCHIAQGFFFDRPLPLPEFEAKLGQSYEIPAGVQAE